MATARKLRQQAITNKVIKEQRRIERNARKIQRLRTELKGQQVRNGSLQMPEWAERV